MSGLLEQIDKKLDMILANMGSGTAKVKTKTAAPSEDVAPKKRGRPPKATIPLEKVVEALRSVITSIGKPAGIEVLAEFGASKAGELKPKDYAAVIKMCEDKIKEAEEEDEEDEEDDDDLGLGDEDEDEDEEDDD